jgi:glycosyltransferase involved in cell wall biosynthesis
VKNQGLLLRAVAKTGLQARVVIVGDGPEAAALRDLAKSLDLETRVRFLGHCDDVHRLLPAFDVFALPSLSEGMSNTLLEAMAAGVPPVVSDVGGNCEIVRDGVEGMVFRSDDEAALATQLSKIGADADLRGRLGRASRARVMESFDIRAMVKRYEALYQRVIAPRV